MKATNYLQRLEDRWYVRVKIPRTLQGRLKNPHVCRAMGTSDLAEANRPKWPVVALIQRELERLVRHHEGGAGSWCRATAMSRRHPRGRLRR